MARWTVEIDIAAKRELERLDAAVRRRVELFLYERVSQLADPRSIGQSMRGPRFGELWSTGSETGASFAGLKMSS